MPKKKIAKSPITLAQVQEFANYLYTILDPRHRFRLRNECRDLRDDLSAEDKAICFQHAYQIRCWVDTNIKAVSWDAITSLVAKRKLPLPNDMTVLFDDPRSCVELIWVVDVDTNELTNAAPATP